MENHNSELHIYFEEENNTPQKPSGRLLKSKRFLPEITVDDYLLRGKIVKLHIKRRRWADQSSGEIHQSKRLFCLAPRFIA